MDSEKSKDLKTYSNPSCTEEDFKVFFRAFLKTLDIFEKEYVDKFRVGKIIYNPPTFYLKYFIRKS